MTPIEFSLVLVVCGLGAGSLGSLVGLGGGFILIPVLTVGFGVDIRLAVGTSLVAVVATSCASAVTFVRDGMANLRVGMFLEFATATGAVTGAWLAGFTAPRLLFVLFGAVLLYSAFAMYRGRHEQRTEIGGRWAGALRLHSTYEEHQPPDHVATVSYLVNRARLGLVLMYLAGTISGLLGIGSGSMKVPAMDIAMGLPIKVSTATSNFMIGVTAAAGTGVYLARGDIDPLLTAPIVLGVTFGAAVGARLVGRLGSGSIRVIFAVVVTLVGADMVVKGIR